MLKLVRVSTDDAQAVQEVVSNNRPDHEAVQICLERDIMNQSFIETTAGSRYAVLDENDKEVEL